MKIPISLVVVTLNEEKNIQRCLESVPFAAEKIVVDTMSTDKTVQIAQECGAKVFSERWRGFGPQKDWGVQQASHDWILSLDADEVLSEVAQQEVIQMFSQLDPQVGYQFPRQSYHLGRWIWHGGWYPDYQLRLFHRQFSAWKKIPIHELVEAPKKIKLVSPIKHFVFQDLAHQTQTNNRYSSLQALEHFESGKKFSYFKVLIKPWTKFIECYFLKKGFLDGFPGFVIAVGAGFSVFLRWVKVWELERKKNEE